MRPFLLILCLVCLNSTNQFSRSTFDKPSLKSLHPFCGTRPDRLQRELQRSRDLRAVRQFRAQRQALSAAAGATQDVGQIAVIEDDGTIVTTQNPFDLPSVTLRLAPAGPGGSYLLSQRQETIGSSFGTAVNLGTTTAARSLSPVGFVFRSSEQLISAYSSTPTETSLLARRTTPQPTGILPASTEVLLASVVSSRTLIQQPDAAVFFTTHCPIASS